MTTNRAAVRRIAARRTTRTDTDTETGSAPRTETRRERRERLSARHTVVLTITAIALAVVLLLAGLNWLGVLPSPFNREFSRTPSGVEAVTVTCPPPDATPVPFGDVTVNVFNGAGAEGLAGSTAEQLTALGFATGTVANWPEDSNVPALIVAGPAGLAHAYTLALAVPDALVTADSRTDTSVDLVLGVNAPALVTPEVAATLPTDQTFVAPADCEPA